MRLADAVRALTLAGWDDAGIRWALACDADELEEVVATVVHAMLWTET
ncbi:hypothetical protein BH11MYX4_BH11MYX4_03830 [soil metagenome]